MAEATQELRIIITAQDRASSVLRGVSSQISAANAALAGAMAGAAGATTALAVQKIGEAFDFASDAVIGFNASLEQSRVGWTTLLGSADKANVILGDLRDLAEQSDVFEFQAAEQAARRLLGMGFAAGQVVPLIKDIGNAAAALGIGSEGISRISLALGQMATRTKVTAEDMLQLTEVGIPAWRILADATGQSVAKIQDAVTKGTVSADVMIDAFRRYSQLNWAQAAEAQGKGFIGMMNSMTEGVRMLLADAFEPLFNGLRRVLALLNEFRKSDFVITLTRQIRAAQIAFAMFFEWTAEQWPAFSKPAIDALNEIGQTFVTFWNVIGPGARQAFDGLTRLAQAAWRLFTDLATGALSAVLIKFNEFTAFLRDVRDRGIPLPGLLNEIADSVVNVDEASQGLRGTLEELPQLAAQSFVDIQQQVREKLVVPLTEGLETAWERAAVAVVPEGVDLGQGMGRALGEGVVQGAKPLFESLARMWAQLWAEPATQALEDTEKAIERAQLLLQVRGTSPEDRTEARRLIRDLTRNVLPGQRLAAFDVTEPVRLATRAEQMATLRQQISQTQVALTVNINHEDGRTTTYTELIEANGQAALPPPVQISGVRRN